MVIKPFESNNAVRKFQDGGMAPEAAPAAPAQGGADQQLQQLAGQVLDSLIQAVGDPQAVAAVLEMALQMLSEAMQSQMGSGAPQEASFYRKGGSLVMKCGGKTKKTKKASCGIKTSKKC